MPAKKQQVATMEPIEKGLDARLLARTTPDTVGPSKIYCAEFAPTRVLCRVDKEYFSLALPYTIVSFAPQRDQLHLAARTKPITPKDQQLGYFPFPHIKDEPGWVCMGYGTDALVDIPDDPLDACIAALMHFMHTGFWYYYVDPHLPEVAKGGPAIAPQSTGRRTDDGNKIADIFNWWEQFSTEEVCTFTYKPIGDLTEWFKARAPAGNRAELEFLF